EHEPVEMGSIEPVHRGPAVEPVTHIRRNALFTRDLDETRNEAVITVAMDRWGEAHHRHAHATRRHRSCCLFRSYARNRGGAGSGYIFFDREATRREEPGPGGDDQGAVRADERGAESFDGVPVGLTVILELRKVVNEGRVDHAVRSGRSAAKARDIFERTAMHIAPCRGKGRGSRVRASE